MSIGIPPASWDFRGFVFCFIFFSSFPGTILTQQVTLDSIRIFKTHDWLSKPTVYFQCKGENKMVLPDVKRANVSYSFKGQESWQPLTELKGTKCKRCGIYEDDTITSDTFDEWELCPSDFTAQGSYTHVKDKEFSSIFICHGCSQVGGGSSNKKSSAEKEEENSGIHPAIVVLIVVLVLGVVAVGLLVGYKYWRKKKRQQEQARFLKLFEDGDEIEDELGLENTV